ncbi:MAG: AAA family ATPase [Hyphomicrobiales bacterium]|nr:AAA family ATPase [Hyphomicrobiales bacterium]
MASGTEPPELRNAHVIVVGNEKGGTGKSTVSIHIVIALLKAGYRVASIDLDTRQRTLTRFLENRQSWGTNAGRSIELPFHHALERGGKDSAGENEIVEFTSFAEAISRIEHEFEFVVIDTPASDSYLMRLAHSLADTLVTPMNDSFIDVDVLARVHNDRRQRGATAQYAALVLEARRQRRLADAGLIDWVVVRNRMASLQSHNQRQVAGSLGHLSPELQFRMAEGLGDRVIFRELFPVGLTVLDSIAEVTEKGALSASQIAARGEVKALIQTLRLPARTDAIPHMEARHLWFEQTLEFYQELVAKGPAEPV